MAEAFQPAIVSCMGPDQSWPEFGEGQPLRQHHRHALWPDLHPRHAAELGNDGLFQFREQLVHAILLLDGHLYHAWLRGCDSRKYLRRDIGD